MNPARAGALYDSAASRALDHQAAAVLGIAGTELMRRAGTAAYAELRARWPAARRLLIACGNGNNGGDGFVLAALAAADGLEATVWLPGGAARAGSDAAHFFAALAGTAVRLDGSAADCTGADVIVDGLLGTGLERPVEGAYAAAIAAINAAAVPRLALDLPSGLNARSGQAPGAVVDASVTVSFIALKPGQLTADGPACCGELALADLALPAAAYAGVAPSALARGWADVAAHFGRRRRTAHKGHFGHVLVVGGAPGYSGAARLAAEAAARVGAGLVSLATHPAHAALLNATRPELMCHGISTPAELRALAARASVLAIGPGLGQSEWGASLFATVRELPQPQVVDADALNLLARDPDRRAGRVLTPHPGEAARLGATDTAAIHADRQGWARRLAERYGGVVVLKGAGSVVQSAVPEALPVIVRGGNPGMASGGMGDVLTGIIAGLLAQGWSPEDAAIDGACLHAAAGDRAAAAGERGLLAQDLVDALRAMVNPPPPQA